MKIKNTLRFAWILVAISHLSAAGPTMIVYKTRTCGCCAKWVDHIRSNGFDVTVKEVSSTAKYHRKYGVPEQLQTCHIATVNGYTIEGHVPAADIQRLLKTRPNAKGLAVPGMPIGSPGMDQSPGSQQYSVLLFRADGSTSEFHNYPGQ